MRAILSKVVAVSLIGGAALLVAACSSSSNTTTNVTETNYMESTVNTTSDDMTGVDAANSMSGNMAGDMTATTNSH